MRLPVASPQSGVPPLAQGSRGVATKSAPVPLPSAPFRPRFGRGVGGEGASSLRSPASCPIELSPVYSEPPHTSPVLWPTHRISFGRLGAATMNIADNGHNSSDGKEYVRLLTILKCPRRVLQFVCGQFPSLNAHLKVNIYWLYLRLRNSNISSCTHSKNRCTAN